MHLAAVLCTPNKRNPYSPNKRIRVGCADSTQATHQCQVTKTRTFGLEAHLCRNCHKAATQCMPPVCTCVCTSITSVCTSLYATLSLAHHRTSFAGIFTPTCFKIDAGYRPLLNGYRPLLNGYRPLLSVYRPRSKKSYSTLNMASVSACSVHHSRDRKRRSNCKSLAAPRLRFRRHVSFTRLVLLSLYRFLIHMYKHTCISPVAVEVPSLFSLFRFPWRSYRRQRRGAFRCRIVGEELKISTTRVLCFRQENPKFPPKKMSSLRFVVGS